MICQYRTTLGKGDDEHRGLHLAFDEYCGSPSHTPSKAEGQLLSQTTGKNGGNGGENGGEGGGDGGGDVGLRGGLSGGSGGKPGGAGGGGNARRLPQSAQSDPMGQPTRANSAPGPPSANGKHT